MSPMVNPRLDELVGLLACPACRGLLFREAGCLRCAGCARTFGFAGRVPDLVLRDDDRPPRLPRRLAARALGNPRFYDVVQARLGGKTIAGSVANALRDLDGGATVLDIGAGTGMVADLMPGDAHYVWLDNDVLKLRGFLARERTAVAVLGDAARLPIADDAVDWAAMVAVSHHVPDDALDVCLREAARVTCGRFLFVDAVRGRRLRSRLLWQLDRGRFPRTEAELVSALSTAFEVVRVERLREIHDYVVCLASPRQKSETAPGPDGTTSAHQADRPH